MGKDSLLVLRASLMIATIAKKADISIIPENKQYQVLCLDVLTRAVNQTFPDLNHNADSRTYFTGITKKGRRCMSTQNGVYVFCAIREKESNQFGKVKLNGQEHEVYTIHYQNVAMVVSKVDGEVLPDRFNLLAHQQTISKVMKQYSVIPMSFGNVFHSEEDVLLITKHMHDEFEKLF